MRSFLSLGFLRPAKAILVPGMYFLGFSRYCQTIRQDHKFDRSALPRHPPLLRTSNKVFSSQTTPLLTLAAVYEKPST